VSEENFWVEQPLLKASKPKVYTVMYLFSLKQWLCLCILLHWKR